MRDPYRVGKQATLGRCIELLKSSNDKESFLRSFMLVALGSVYCPGTGNSISLKYLRSLHDVSKIKDFDLAEHILDVLMDAVRHYQNLSSEQLDHDHNIAGCLAIFAIAYMYHLDIPQNRDTHQICYDLPRICKVTREDFDFVMRVDRHRMQLHSFGKLSFQDVTPYSAPTTTEPPSTTEPHLADDVHVRSSLDDWLHPSGFGGPSEQQVLAFYQSYMTEMNEHIEHDIDELSKSMVVEYKVKCKAICQKRMAEMIAKISKGPCSTCNATSKASTSGGMPPDSSAGQGEKSGQDDAVKEGARLDSSNANPSPSPHKNPAAHEVDAGGNKMSSGSFEKKNRRRRAAVDLNLGKKPKRIKLQEDAKVAYENL